ncbi:hypothetical protein VSU19_11100 [Verrucomicrobiales bacterium BCK34]|nr:hypothetical protein [Verrucomicrobiales bacterium BCK34]
MNRRSPQFPPSQYPQSMPLEKAAIQAEEPIPLPVLILFWVSAAGLIDAAIYEYLKAAYFLFFSHELPRGVNWLNIIFLPVGIGLIKRSPDSRSCFQSLLALILILFLAMVGFELFGSEAVDMDRGPTGWFLVTGISVWSIVLLWCFNRYESYFSNPVLTPEARKNETALVWFVVISAILSNLAMVSKEYGHEKEFDEIFAVNLEFYPVNAESGELIERAIFDAPFPASGLISQSASFSENDGLETIRWKTSGIAKAPFTVGFSAPGYINNKLTVTREMAESGESEVAVKLRPVAELVPKHDKKRKPKQ